MLISLVHSILVFSECLFRNLYLACNFLNSVSSCNKDLCHCVIASLCKKGLSLCHCAITSVCQKRVELGRVKWVCNYILAVCATWLQSLFFRHQWLHQPQAQKKCCQGSAKSLGYCFRIRNLHHHLLAGTGSTCFFFLPFFLTYIYKIKSILHMLKPQGLGQLMMVPDKPLPLSFFFPREVFFPLLYLSWIEQFVWTSWVKLTLLLQTRF
jgi:hypothetical protein